MNPRVYFIRMPKESFGPWIGGVLLLLASIWFSSVAAIELGVDFVSPFPIAIALTLLATSGFSCALGIQRRRDAVRAMSGRIRRLESFLAHRDASARFPHRAVELHVRQKRMTLTRKRLNDLLTRCPPGTVILCHTPSVNEVPLPNPRVIGFEPIPQDDAGCQRLLRLGYADAIPRQLLSDTLNLQQPSLLRRVIGHRYLRKLLKVILNILFVVYKLALVCATLYFMHRGDWGLFSVTLGSILITIVTLLLTYHLMPQVWMIPRGLLLAPHSPLRKRLNYSLRSRATHRLYYGPYKARTVLHMVSSEKIDGRLDISLTGLYAILTAWLSEARPPTQEDIESFLRGRQ